MAKKPHPIQPLSKDKHGVLRFKENKIVVALLDFASSRGMDLNKIATMDFSREDEQQLAQLIGYSLSGYGDLSYVTKRAWERAVEESERHGAKQESRDEQRYATAHRSNP